MGKGKNTNVISLRRLMLALIVIACGVTLRLAGYQAGLPYFLVKYGGSLLWGMMVFWLIGSVLNRYRIMNVVYVAILVAVITEFTRLYHTPWLDAFRLTLAGALILGRIFSWANILAYVLGIGLAALIECRQQKA